MKMKISVESFFCIFHYRMKDAKERISNTEDGTIKITNLNKLKLEWGIKSPKPQGPVRL